MLLLPALRVLSGRLPRAGWAGQCLKACQCQARTVSSAEASEAAQSSSDTRAEFREQVRARDTAGANHATYCLPMHCAPITLDWLVHGWKQLCWCDTHLQRHVVQALLHG